MELNSLFFPAPPSSYTYQSHKGKLIFIPRAPIVNNASNFKTIVNYGSEPCHIPCLYLKYKYGSSKVLIYFHANAEDIGTAEDELLELGCLLGVHVILVEYPGYGIYKGDPYSARILEDAINVFDYLAYVCSWEEQNIILLGRSIGTGPAVYLASKKNPAALLLVSPFTSVRGVVGGLAGDALKFLVRERFNNLQAIVSVKCPTLLIHGKVDTLIPFTQSVELYNACMNCPCEIELRDDMDHNEISFYDDVEKPIMDFLMKYQIQTEASPITKALLKLPGVLYYKPISFPEPPGPGFFSKLFYKVFR
eukprot:TRINITY_DN91692_c0_g1_i1.p1 TRINITY_DN91692_c0_g1~~TRINITY_DN91692_c0_g1_i1.p1  ORF type:complete len:343 (+),score=21.74 TRINITY_DN91692_c0_g1_i1:111-1031(+)